MKMTATNPYAWGIIPSFITDGRPIGDQIGEAYIGGWSHFDGFELLSGDDTELGIKYPGDPEMFEVARLYVEDEGHMQMLVMFPYAWVMWFPDAHDLKIWQIARID